MYQYNYPCVFSLNSSTTLKQGMNIGSQVESTMDTPPAGPRRPNNVTQMSDQFIGATSKVKQIDEDGSAKIKDSYQNAQNRSNDSDYFKPLVYTIFIASIIGVMGTLVISNWCKY